MMELNYETIKNDCVTLVARTQTVVNSEVTTADRGGASKLLSVNTDAAVTSVEAVAGEAHVFGKVTYKVIYLDQEGKVGGLDYFGEFDVVVSDERIAIGAATAEVSVLDSQCQIASDVLRFGAVCDIRICQIVSHEDKAIVSTPCENLVEEAVATTLSPLAEAVFELVEETESGCTVDRVLLFDAKAIKTGVTQGVNNSLVEGVLYADVVFLSQGVVRSMSINAPFSEEVDIEGESDVVLSLRSSRLVLTGEDDNNVLRLEATLSCKGYSVQRQNYSLVKDVFCPDNDVAIQRACFVCRTPLGAFCHTHRLSASLDATDFQSAVAAFASRVNIATLLAQDNAIVAEGLVVVGVLYEDAEGSLSSGQVEIPFSFAMDAEGVGEDALLCGNGIGLEARVGSHGDVSVQLLLCVDAYRPQKICYAVGVTELPLVGKQAVASVYYASSEDTLWDIAHAVHLSPAKLLELNPSLQEPSKETRRVLIFRHRDLR